MIRDAVSLVSCAQNTVQGPRLLDHGALLRAPGSCALGGFIGIGWKGTRDRRIFSQASMLLRRSGTNVAFAGVENLSALPIGTPPRKRPEISHGGCHMVARKKWPIREF